MEKIVQKDWPINPHEHSFQPQALLDQRMVGSSSRLPRDTNPNSESLVQSTHVKDFLQRNMHVDLVEASMSGQLIASFNPLNSYKIESTSVVPGNTNSDDLSSCRVVPGNTNSDDLSSCPARFGPSGQEGVGQTAYQRKRRKRMPLVLAFVMFFFHVLD